MERDQRKPYARQRRFYVLVGTGALALLALSCILRREALSRVDLLLHLLGVVVVAAWAVSGIVAVRRRERKAREAAAAQARAREEARRVQAEARQATERAVREVMARRTTSHGGLTISVHRAPADGPAPAAPRDEDGGSR